MIAAVAAALALGVAAAWLGALALLRLRTPLERLHAVAFVNVAAGGGVTLAALLADGPTPRALKSVAVWLATLLIGACLAHVTGRALHLRGGDRL